MLKDNLVAVVKYRVRMWVCTQNRVRDLNRVIDRKQSTRPSVIPTLAEHSVCTRAELSSALHVIAS